RYVSPAALGRYTVSREISDLALTEILAPLRQTLFPGFGAIKHDRTRLRRSVRTATATLIGIALPLGVGLALFAEEALMVLVGAKWLDAAIVIQILAPIGALTMFAAPIDSLAMALRDLKGILWRNILVASLSWTFIYVGIQEAGFIGAVIGVGAARFSRVVINLFFLKRMVDDRIGKTLAANWRTALATGVMAGTLILLPRGYDPAALGSLPTLAATLPYVALGIAVYAGTLFALWRLAGRPAHGIEENVLHYGGVAVRHLKRRFAT
ncbi:MAG: oligosaccharide flippase family protein, partial [Pseudomonadota bacterium]